ncbi:MAG: beta-ketoacyl-[Clostridia bacterium]|nr:beta-ketoacyl-[acyl-carrier-protein] synthase family protein [Clostridia bacterium]
MKRVVVTGMGVCAPGSVGKDTFWRNLSQGKVFTGQLTQFSCKDLRVKIAGEVTSFTEDEYLPDANGINFKSLDRVEKFAIKTIDMALADSKVDLSKIKSAVISLGTTMGKMSKERDKSIDYKIYEDLISIGNNSNNNIIKEMHPGDIVAKVCRYFSLENIEPRMFLNACAAGNYAIGWGYDRIKNEDADFAIVGGVDSFSLTALIGFNRLLSLTPNLCCPFDKNRKGLVVSEGCGILILENLESALQRNAHIYGEIKGYGLSVDAYHITAPRPDASGATICMQKALKNAKVSPYDIDYISAHGTGTKVNDKIEAKALCAVFGEKIPPISSIKSMIGHSLGAAAAIEAVASLLMLKYNLAVPTANFEEADEDCPVDCIPNISRPMKIDTIISNAFAFGGNNSSLVISRYKEG